jgi:hypothetical protein
MSCDLPPTTKAECALVENREWRDGHCYPTTEKTCLFSPYHVWYKKDPLAIGDATEGCFRIPTLKEDCDKAAFFDWSDPLGNGVFGCHHMEVCRGSSKRIWVYDVGSKGSKDSFGDATTMFVKRDNPLERAAARKRTADGELIKRSPKGAKRAKGAVLDPTQSKHGHFHYLSFPRILPCKTNKSERLQ